MELDLKETELIWSLIESVGIELYLQRLRLTTKEKTNGFTRSKGPFPIEQLDRVVIYLGLFTVGM